MANQTYQVRQSVPFTVQTTTQYQLETLNLGIANQVQGVEAEPTYPTLVILTLLPTKGHPGSLNEFETVSLKLEGQINPIIVHKLGVVYHTSLTKEIYGTKSISYSKESVPLKGFTETRNYELNGEVYGTISVNEEQYAQLKQLAAGSSRAPMIGIRRNSHKVNAYINPEGELRLYMALYNKAMSDIKHIAS